MAKLKDDYSAYQDTQPIDSRPSSPSDFESFEDCALINDQNVETQIMDTQYDDEEFLLCGETLTVDLGFETQEEPILEGKQLLESFDGLSTQLLDHCDDDVTLIMEDNSELSDSDDARSKARKLLSSEGNRQKANKNASSNEHGISGNRPRFASVRSAAFRASALAARVATQKFPNSDCCTLVNCHSSGQGATNYSTLEYSFGEVGNQQCPPSISVEKKDGLRTRNRIARKLFPEDSPVENCPSVAMSYFDSQEPAEESQASALNLVDKLIRESCVEFALDVETDSGRRTEEKLKFVSSIKGPLELAKKLSYKIVVIGNGTFDWDDSREDEGGGGFFCRKKEELYGSHKGLGVAVDNRKAHSDSKLLQHNVITSRKNIQAAKKKPCKEFAEVSEDRNKKRFGMREVEVLGNDTEVAAETIDTLCSGDLSKFDAKELSRKELSPVEDRGFSRCGVITRQSKGSKRIQAMGKDELLKRKMKKASPISAKACGENIERYSKDNQLNKEGPCCLKRRKVQTASRETKKNLVDELDEVSKESHSRRFDRHEEVEAGSDTQMAVEAISALNSGATREIDPKPNCLIGKKLSLEGGISSRGVVTRKSKRIKGIQAVDNDIDSLKPKTKKARSVLANACEKNMDRYPKNDKIDMPDEVVVSSTEKSRGELSNKSCTRKLLNQSSRGEAEVLSYPKLRRSARMSQDQIIEAGRSSDPAFDTPVKSKSASKTVSPICMGDEYYRISSFKPNTTREFRNLTSPSVESISETKSTRKRRDMGSIRVLFSQHLDEDVTKHQKKILARFNISEASSMMEATHFIADNFMRTRNMLEAIASGKPVVTTQWLESIDEVNIYVDEDLYILRDSKKEKEFGFNMGVSLARARQYPLLQGRRVFITPNTKPGLNTIMTLVKAVHGLPVQRLGRSALGEDKVRENLLVLSCEEDQDICIPFLERGAEVYSSELLLNGIVTQKLEYERYHLFADHVRRTRSTIRIRDAKGNFQRRSG